MSVNLYISAIRDKVEKLSQQYDSEPEAFLHLVFYLMTGLSVDDLDPEDIIDGAGDNQIDVIHIQRGESDATVTVFQATYSDSLSSNKLTLMKEGLKYLLEYPSEKYNRLSNFALSERIKEFRELRSEIGPANISLHCAYASLGDTRKTSPDFKLVADGIMHEYGPALGEFDFQVLGPRELSDLLMVREQSRRKVDEKLKIIYDQNKANLLEHSLEAVSGVICTVEASEIARVVDLHPNVFDDNLRRFLGLKGDVNKAISDSCSSEETAPLFWFLNNGITIVCDDCDINKDYDNPSVSISNLRIVNGCQTATTIAKAASTGKLLPSTRIMVRIFETKSIDLASRLVITTNTQNKMKSRELHAQDEIQETLQNQFKAVFEILYERTPNEFTGKLSAQDREVISNEKIGQAYLAVVKGKTGDANRRRYKMWGEYYDEVFNTRVYPEAYLLAYRIVEYWRKQQRKRSRDSRTADLRDILARNGTFHLSYIAAAKWRGSQRWDERKLLRRELTLIEADDSQLEGYFDDALNMLVELIKNDTEFKNDLSVALKSPRLDGIITKKLFGPG